MNLEWFYVLNTCHLTCNLVIDILLLCKCLHKLWWLLVTKCFTILCRIFRYFHFHASRWLYDCWTMVVEPWLNHKGSNHDLLTIIVQPRINHGCTMDDGHAIVQLWQHHGTYCGSTTMVVPWWTLIRPRLCLLWFDVWTIVPWSVLSWNL